MRIPEHNPRGCRLAFPALTVTFVVGLVAICLGLFIQAVHEAHRAATKMSCSNNLKQLGLALHTYHDTYDVYPTSSLHLTVAQSNNPYVWSRAAKGSRLVKLLPYLESSPYYSQLNFELAGIPTTEPGGFNRQRGGYAPDLDGRGYRRDATPPNGWVEIRSVIIPSLICPAADVDPYIYRAVDRTSAPAVSFYALSMGAQRMDSQADWCLDYRGNQFQTGSANHGITAVGNEISGVFGRPWTAKFRDLLDGQSQIIAGGEVLPQKGSFFTLGWVHYDSDWAATTAPVNYPIRGVGEKGFPGRGDCHHFSNWQTSQGFKSQHKGGAQFVMADGSTQFLMDNIDYLTYQRLGDRRDGQPLGGNWNRDQAIQ